MSVATAPASTVSSATAPGPLALPPAPPVHRPRTLLVATVLVIAAGTMLFGALFGAFFAAQDAAEVWPPEGVTLPNVALVVAYVTLLMSSFTAQWAVTAVGSGERRSMYLAVGLTMLLGGAFLNAMTFAWSQLGLVAGSGAYANAVYAITVTHVLVVVAAMIAFLVMGFRALGGQFDRDNREVVQAAALFWHFVVAAGACVWFFVWFLEGMPRT